MTSIRRKTSQIITNLRFRTSKKRLRAPITLITATIVLFTAFCAGGGLYDLFDNPPTILGGGAGGYIAVRGFINEQTLTESFLSMVLTILIFSGLYASYRSTQIIYDAKRARTIMIIGIALILMGLSGSYYLINLKQYVIRTYGV